MKTIPTMIEYISDQDRALLETFNNRAIFVNKMRELLLHNDIRKIYLIGSGTSNNASIAGKCYFEKFMKIETFAEIPSNFTNYTNPIDCNNLEESQIMVIGISQSGTSVSTIEAICKANDKGYITVAMTDAMDSLITKETNNVVKLTCGKEEIPVETRGYSVTVFELFLIAVEIGFAMGKIQQEEYKYIIQETEYMLKHYTETRLCVEKWYLENSVELQAMDRTVIAGYGINECTAIEGVLKLGETYKRPVISYNIEEMIHGPQYAFDTNTYIFLIASKEKEYERVPVFVEWFKENNITDHVFVITDGNMIIDRKSLRLPALGIEDLSPLYFILPFQIVSARNCVAAGINTSVRAPHRKSFAHFYKEDNK